MEKDVCTVTICGKITEYPIGTDYGTVIFEQCPEIFDDTILVRANGVLCELFKTCREDTILEPLSISTNIGMATYKRSVVFMMITAINKLSKSENKPGVRVHFSLDNGVFCTVDGVDVTSKWLESVKNKMLSMVASDIPVNKHTGNTLKVRRMFQEIGQGDKYRLLKTRLSSSTRYYELDGELDYYYGYMAPRTGMLKYFDFCSYDDGFVLMFPNKSDYKTVSPFKAQDKIYQAMREMVILGDASGIRDIGDLNRAVIDGNARQLILCQEARQEKKIGDVAAEIAADRNKKFILIAGPSSSGKTSFANRLCIQLINQGITPHMISADNYFIDRDKIPLDENGEPDLESIHAMDIELLNKHLLALLNGETIELPYFNFKKGKREFHGDTLKLGEGQVLVIEGIHCMNDLFSRDLPSENKYRIFISALTTLSVDDHNRIPSTDNRLIRRMCRDARTRGISAQQTIAMWDNVRKGEEKNIFPYQGNADFVFNSALLYELAVEKVFCEKLLYGIPEDSEEYIEAKRLLKFLGYLIPVDSEDIPHNSIVREFIGNSVFDV